MIHMELSGTFRSDSILISFSCKEKEGGETAFRLLVGRCHWPIMTEKAMYWVRRSHEELRDIFVLQKNVATHHIGHRLNI